MGLRLYDYNATSGQFEEFSPTPATSDPISFNVSGATGGTIRKKIWIHNDEPTFYFTDIQIQPEPSDLVGPSNSRGITFKLLSGDAEPPEKLWEARVSGDPVTSIADMGLASTKEFYIPEIGSSTSPDSNYYPIWVETKVPPHTPALVEIGIKITIYAEKGLIP